MRDDGLCCRPLSTLEIECAKRGKECRTRKHRSWLAAGVKHSSLRAGAGAEWGLGAQAAGGTAAAVEATMIFEASARVVVLASKSLSVWMLRLGGG